MKLFLMTDIFFGCTGPAAEYFDVFDRRPGRLSGRHDTSNKD